GAVANRFVAAHPESPFAPGARYAVALARDRSGHREAAREALAELARDRDTAVGREAAARLDSPEWNRLAELDAAERQHARDVARYVLFGGGLLDGRSALYPAVHRRLADAYERAGNPGRALLHYQALPDPDPKRIARLENELGDSLLAQA